MPERFELSTVSNAPDILPNAGIEDLATWSSSRTPIVVEYSRAVMNKIRLEAIDKFMSIPRGGVEIGGVLFGSVEGNRVTVRAHRPFVIEYKTGPRFVLLPADEESFQKFLDSSSEDPELEQLEPVGWYHSHTRSDVFLSPEDIAVHDKFFPRARQIALVVRPAKLQPTRAGFFVREPDGSIFSESSYNEFLIENGPAGPPETLAVALPEPPEPPKTIVMRPRPVVVPRSKPRKNFAIPALAAVAIIVAALAMLAPRGSGPQAVVAKPAPALRLAENGDNLLIEWSDPGTPPAEASRGALEIFDGGAGKLTIPLDRESVRGGSVTYARNSRNVEVRLRVYGADSISSEAVARYVKPVVPAVDEQARARTTVEQALSPASPDINARAPVTAVVENATNSLKPLKKAILPTVTRSRQTPPVDIARTITGAEQAPQINSSGSVSALLPRIPVQPAPMPTVANSVPLASGRTMWTGELRKGGVLMIDGGRPSIGTLNGRLPQGPIRINAHAAELIDGGIVVYTGGTKESLSEPPSARNGWNLTVYRSDPKRVRDIGVIESPSEQNNWRLVVRGGARNVGLIVLDWQQLAGGK